MCNACGIPARAGYWTNAGLRPPRMTACAQGFAAPPLLNTALRHCGLTAITTPPPTASPCPPRCACKIVTNPNDLWPAAQGLAKCSIDLPQPLQFD